jgi:hypothetical protein
MTELAFRRQDALWVPDGWAADRRTDLAIELMHRVGGAKTTADGTVVPRHRYSRGYGLGDVLLAVIEDSRPGLDVTIRHERLGSGRRFTVELSCPLEDGEFWEQRGACVYPTEDTYSPAALAVCRALLQYVDDDGETMTTDEVLTMLEQQRAEVLEHRRSRTTGDG